MLLNKLKEEDFEVLRGPFESKRQSPNSLGPMLILSAFLQALMFFLTYVVLADSTSYPFREQLFSIHLVVTIVLIILSILFGIPVIFKNFQKTQYFITILVSQNLFASYAYIGALFTLGSDEASDDALIMLTLISLVAGVLVFIITCVRFYILLKKGKYQRGTDKENQRRYFEKKSLMPMAIVGGLGVVYIIQFAARNGYTDINDLVFILLGHYYSM